MTVQNLSNMVLAFKEQSGGLGSAESGSGAAGLEVIPSQGLSENLQTIQSQILQRNRLQKRPRQGSRLTSMAYETEFIVGALDDALEAVMGGTWTATFDITESDITSAAISGTGTTVTAGGGSFITEGVRAGMMGKFANMTNAANNNVWFPITAVTASTLTVPTGFLTDETADTAFTLTIAKSLATADPYTDRLFTIEEYLTDIDRSKLGVDMRFNRFGLDAQPDAKVKAMLGATGRDLQLLATGDSPNFTSPTFIDRDSLTLLDGTILINGTARTNLTGFSFSFEAPVSGQPVLGSVTSPDVFVGQFALTGNFTGVVEDGTDFDLYDAETQISVLLHMAEQGTAGNEEFITIYLGNLVFGGWDTPSGGEGAMIQTIPLMGGEDERGTGYHASTMVISTSAA